MEILQYYAADFMFQDCPPFPGLPQYVRIIAGATLTAVKTIIDGTADIVVYWDGGR